MGAVEVDSAAGRTGPQILRLAAGAGTFLLIARLSYFAWADGRCARRSRLPSGPIRASKPADRMPSATPKPMSPFRMRVDMLAIATVISG
ncbi:MAG: hypothetical protein WA231_07960, partial [Methylocella sp.]